MHGQAETLGSIEILVSPILHFWGLPLPSPLDRHPCVEATSINVLTVQKLYYPHKVYILVNVLLTFGFPSLGYNKFQYFKGF